MYIDNETCHKIIKVIKLHKNELSTSYYTKDIPIVKYKSEIHNLNNILDKLCIHEWYDDHIETDINEIKHVTYCLFCERNM